MQKMYMYRLKINFELDADDLQNDCINKAIQIYCKGQIANQTF